MSGIKKFPVNSRMRAPLMAAIGGTACRSIVPRKLSECGQADGPCRPPLRFASPIGVRSHLTERRYYSFDGKKQRSAVGRIFDELGAFHVEAFRRIVFGVDQNRSNTDTLRGDGDAA